MSKQGKGNQRKVVREQAQSWFKYFKGKGRGEDCVKPSFMDNKIKYSRNTKAGITRWKCRTHSVFIDTAQVKAFPSFHRKGWPIHFKTDSDLDDIHTRLSYAQAEMQELQAQVMNNEEGDLFWNALSELEAVETETESEED
uniref:Uncharacterized protein n=1 Tax=Amphimedon queenslandica TaxID=400682 RepID=A0A1X7V8T1_AMPQE